MAGIVAGVATSAATSAACSAASCCCGSLCAASPGHTRAGALRTRITYMIFFGLAGVSAWVFSNWGSELFSKIPARFQLLDCEADACWSTLSVYRICTALILFFAVQAVAMIRVKDTGDARDGFQNGYWIIKFLVLVALCVAMFAIPNEPFVYLFYLYIVGAGIFIILQLISFVDLAHSWSESWMEKYERDTDDKFYFYALLAATSVFYAGSLALCLVLYIMFTSSAGNATCALNITFITINVLAVFVISGVSVHPKIQERNPRSGLLQASMVSLYSFYLVWSAILAEPTEWNCGTFLFSQQPNRIISVIVMCVSVCYSTFSLSGKGAKLMGTDDPVLAAPLLDGTEGSGAAGSEGATPTKPVVPTIYSYSFFHFCFCFASMYLCMVMTNWSEQHSVMNAGVGDAVVTIDRSEASFWVKMASGWLAILLYMWSLIAPLVLSNRDFGYA